ncbi:unnamed protein product [Durusdinium trenchii]|uniref:Peptidase C19 ubiquitin carboxyl-terminal hydrolase domain-containing protein n=1 Tax=Durusdinium trenchii TaxID=1381693 RepID=A0ABP0M6Y0_9DINO
MGVEKHGAVYRARIKVAGGRQLGPSRQLLAAAEADQRKLEAARAAGADMGAVIKQLFASMEVDARAARVEECIEKCKDSFRARVKKQGHTYFGPRRTMRSEALEDAKTLLAAGDITIPALQAAETRLKEESGLPEMSLEKAVLEAMSYWLRQGSTSEMAGVSRALKTRMRRVTKGSEQDALFDAAKLLVKDHLEMEHFAQQASAEWLWEKGVHLRLDYGSRPRDTFGLEDRFCQTGLRNLGNSCYLNAVVQCMVACQPLRRDLSQKFRKGQLRTCMEELTQVWHLRPNRDAAATKLENVFVFARQFLDGSLERIFTVPGSRDDGEKDSEDWKVDVDMLFALKCPAHKLMLPHIAESLRQLGRLGGGLMDDGEVESQNGPYSKCFGKWAGLSPDEVREDILQELQPLSHHRGVKDLMSKLSNGSSGEALVLINACKCIHVVKNWCFVVRSNSSSTF